MATPEGLQIPRRRDLESTSQPSAAVVRPQGPASVRLRDYTHVDRQAVASVAPAIDSGRDASTVTEHPGYESASWIARVRGLFGTKEEPRVHSLVQLCATLAAGILLYLAFHVVPRTTAVPPRTTGGGAQSALEDRSARSPIAANLPPVTIPVYVTPMPWPPADEATAWNPPVSGTVGLRSPGTYPGGSPAPIPNNPDRTLASDLYRDDERLAGAQPAFTTGVQAATNSNTGGRARSADAGSLDGYPSTGCAAFAAIPGSVPQGTPQSSPERSVARPSRDRRGEPSEGGTANAEWSVARSSSGPGNSQDTTLDVPPISVARLNGSIEPAKR